MHSKEETCRLRHDILGPLNVASGFLELLSAELQGAPDSVAGEYLTQARDGVSRAIAIAVRIGTEPSGASGTAEGGSQGTKAVSPGSGGTEGNS